MSRTDQREDGAVRRPAASRGARRAWAITVSAVAAPLADAQPVGSTLIDFGWSALTAGSLAYFASSAKRGPLLFAAAVAVIGARSGLAVGAAGIAVAAAATSTRHLLRRAVFARGMAGGAAAVSVLASSMDQPAPVTLLLVIGVVVPILLSALHGPDQRLRRRLRWTSIALGTMALVACAAAAIGVASSARQVDAGSSSLRLGLAAARQGDTEAASTLLADALASVSSARSTIDRWGAAGRLVPGVAQHLRAVTGVLADVERAAGQAVRTATIAESAELTVRRGRIDVEAIGELTNPFKRLVASLDAVVAESQFHLDRPLLGALDSRLRVLRDEAARASRDARAAEHATLEMPRMLGRDGPRRYLVLFTSPSEARGRFGFPGSFAEVIFQDGRLRLGEQGTTSAEFGGLNADQTVFDQTDDLLRPYVPFGATRLMVNATIPPDFPTAAEVAATLWEESGRRPVHGVLRFDTASLAALLTFTGPVAVDGLAEPLTSENLEQFLNFGQYVQFPDDQAPRRELLETVAEVTSERLQTADLPRPRALVDLFGPLAVAGRFNVTAFDDRSARFLERVGLDGGLPAPETTDSLLVTNVNSTGNKLDSFLRRSVRYSAEVQDGSLEATVGVRLENTAPGSKLPFYVIGSFTRPPLPRGTNRTTLLVYSAGRAEQVLVAGSPVDARIERTGGRWLHQVVVELPPQSSVDITLRMAPTAWREPYALRLEPGGGVRPDAYEVEVRTDDPRPVTYSGRVEAPTVVK